MAIALGVLQSLSDAIEISSSTMSLWLSVTEREFSSVSARLATAGLALATSTLEKRVASNARCNGSR
jgi:hypothetical protein